MNKFLKILFLLFLIFSGSYSFGNKPNENALYLSSNNIKKYITECRQDLKKPLAEKIHLNRTVKSIYNYLGFYNEYSYSYADLITREKIKKMDTRSFYNLIAGLESKGGAVPLSVSEEYSQYVAEYGTASAYFLGQQYEGMIGVVYCLYGISASANMTSNALKDIAKQRQKMFL